ncbi:unnamed protein product [Pleuronectes platessa]|uniref:Uncharacterized protein n=1 Tax=Pleuronectes platessa TaxID=8262 RepID=A0A9N7UCT1_PLEPL|nr:unnamed protein product [Pleuronectes platessa]
MPGGKPSDGGGRGREEQKGGCLITSMEEKQGGTYSITERIRKVRLTADEDLDYVLQDQAALRVFLGILPFLMKKAPLITYKIVCHVLTGAFS